MRRYCGNQGVALITLALAPTGVPPAVILGIAVAAIIVAAVAIALVRRKR